MLRSIHYKSCLVLAVAFLLFPACREGGIPGPGFRPQEEEPAAKAEINIVETRAIDPRDRPEASQKAAEAAPLVQTLLNDFYAGAFVDTARWGEGKHESLSGLFTGEAQPQVGPNLGGLALADLAPKLERVDPTKQEARLTFMVEDDLSLPIGVVTTSFEADGTAKEKSDNPVKIAHSATFWLLREGDSYKISAFQAELKADTATEAADSQGVPGQ